MRSASFIVVFSVAIAALLSSSMAAQRLAFAWEKNSVSDRFVSALTLTEHSPLKLVDTDLSQTAIKSAIGEKLSNLTAEQGVLAANVAGTEFVAFVRAEALRRNSFELGDHYEAWAAIFLINGRDGSIVKHLLVSGKGKTEKEAIEKLESQATETIKAVSLAISSAKRSVSEKPDAIATVPVAGSPAAVGFVAPIPFKRIKPEYTQTAYLYSVAATIEIEIDLDEAGKISRTQIVRWAGFGLDESVDKAVREMQWRPAYFGKTARPIRFVAQYNFRKPQ